MSEGVTDVLSVGHSTHTYETFLALLRAAGVTAIADVRSAPYSQYTPHFNRETLENELKRDGIAYVFLGEELGGRPTDTQLFCDGVADYERMAQVPAFAVGVDRVIDGANRHRIALMCSENDPLDCHRCLLVGRALKERGLAIRHILPNGQIKSQTAIEDELLAMVGQNLDQTDIFTSSENRLAVAYRNRAGKVAYAVSKLGCHQSVAAE